MPDATVRANARALPKAAIRPDASIIKRVNRRHNQPGLYEKGLEVLAKEISDNEVDRKILALHAEFKQLRAKTSSIRTRFEPLEVAYAAIIKNDGAEKAFSWGHQSEYWALNDELSDIEDRLTNILDGMIKLRPRKQDEIAAVAAAFKDDQDHFWKKPKSDRDWEISLLTRLIDGLIDLVQAPCVPEGRPDDCRRQKHNAPLPSASPAPDCAPAGLARQNAWAVTGAIDLVVKQ